MEFTFIISTPDQKGKTKHFLPDVNSHVATFKNARRQIDYIPHLPQKQHEYEQVWQAENRQVSVQTSSSREGSLEVSKRSTPLSIDNPNNSTPCDELQSHALAKEGFDHQLLRSSLDPMIKTKLDLNQAEKSLLQFWLMDGRRFAFGTTKNPTFCPGIHAATCMMASSPLYVHVHLACADLMLSRMRSHDSGPSETFYRHLGLSYRAMKALLCDKNATNHQKISALQILSMIEDFLGKRNVRAMHVEALQRFVKMSGGIRTLMDRVEEESSPSLPLYLDCGPVMGLYMYTGARIHSESKLNVIATRFITDLKRVHTWKTSKENEMRSKTSTVRLRQDPDTQAPLLRCYISWLLETFLSDRVTDVDHPYVPSAFSLLLTLCLAQMNYILNKPETRKMFERLEYHISESVDLAAKAPFNGFSAPDLNNSTTVNHFCCAPQLICCIFGVVRHESFFPKSNEIEAKLYQSVIDAAQLLPLMSTKTRVGLAKELSNCVFIIMENSTMDAAKRTYIRSPSQLRNEFIEAWLTQQSEKHEKK